MATNTKWFFLYQDHNSEFLEISIYSKLFSLLVFIFLVDGCFPLRQGISISRRMASRMVRLKSPILVSHRYKNTDAGGENGPTFILLTVWLPRSESGGTSHRLPRVREEMIAQVMLAPASSSIHYTGLKSKNVKRVSYPFGFFGQTYFSQLFLSGEKERERYALLQDWFDAVTSPLHKKTQEFCWSNFRSMSRTRKVSKLMKYLTSHDLCGHT